LYEWKHGPETMTVAPLPEWLLRLIVDDPKPKPERHSSANTILEGQRNATLTSLAGTMRRRGFGFEAIFQALLAENDERCQPPLPTEEVERIAQSVARYEPEAADPADEDPGGERYTDMANAARLADAAAGRIAHVEEMKDKWYVYDGGRLNLESKTAVVPYVKAIARRLYGEAADLAEDARRAEESIRSSKGNLSQMALADKEVQVKTIKKCAMERHAGADRLESRDGCYAAIELAKAEPSIRLKIEALDAHPTWLNTPTGTLNLVTGEV
jgi:Primase C terminal 1 (PriCT-1)/D5 N terminal like